MTTPQIYALFAMIICMIILIGITYCAALKTGKAAGEKARQHLRNNLRAIHADYQQQNTELASTLQILDMRERELATARKNLKTEFDDHTRVEQMLFKQLTEAKTKGLTTEDYLTLKLAAKQLGTAAAQFIKSGSNKINQARLAQTRLNDVADRLQAALTTPAETCQPSDAFALVTQEAA
jgi:hypothetical protein